MIGKTILQYEILEQLGEVPIRLDLTSKAMLSPIAELRIPPKGGSWGGIR